MKIIKFVKTTFIKLYLHGGEVDPEYSVVVLCGSGLVVLEGRAKLWGPVARVVRRKVPLPTLSGPGILHQKQTLTCGGGEG